MVLSAILALSAAAPSGITLHSGLVSPWIQPTLIKTIAPVAEYHVPSIAKVGSIVSHVPTSISHQSSTVVHNHGAVVTPILTPVHKTLIAPISPIHASPLAYSAPLWNEPLISSW